MNKPNQIPGSFASAMIAGSGLIIAAVILASIAMKQEPAPLGASRPTVSAPADPEKLAPAREVPAPHAKPITRPEVAIMQGLPKVRVTQAPGSPLSDLKVSFKLDSRLTKSLYMGDRWLAPPTYLQMGTGIEGCTVEASIRGLNARGKAVNTLATWRAADPEMVHVSESGPGNTVKLTVVRPGQTTIEIASQGIIKELPLRAWSYGGTLMVAMAQE